MSLFKYFIIFIIIIKLTNGTSDYNYNSDDFVEVFDYINYYHGKNYFNNEDIGEEYINQYGEIKRTGINLDALINPDQNFDKLIFFFKLGFNKFEKTNEFHYNLLKEIDLISIFFRTFDVFRIKLSLEYLTDSSSPTIIKETRKEDNFLYLKIQTYLERKFWFLFHIDHSNEEYSLKLYLIYSDNFPVIDNKVFQKKIKLFDFEKIKSIFPNLYLVINENEILNNLIYENFTIIKDKDFVIEKLYIPGKIERFFYYPTKKLISINVNDHYYFDKFMLNKLNNEYINIIDNNKFEKYLIEIDGKNRYFAKLKNNNKTEIFNINNLSYDNFQNNVIKLSLIFHDDLSDDNLKLFFNGIEVEDRISESNDVDIDLFYDFKIKEIKKLKKTKAWPLISDWKLLDLYFRVNDIENFKLELQVNNDKNYFFKKIEYFKGKINIDFDTDWDIYYKTVIPTKFDYDYKKIDENLKNISLYTFKNYNFLCFFKFSFEQKNNDLGNKNLNFKVDNKPYSSIIFTLINNLEKTSGGNKKFEFYGIFNAFTYVGNINDFFFNINDVFKEDNLKLNENLNILSVEFYNFYYYDFLYGEKKKFEFSVDCNFLFNKDKNIYFNYYFNDVEKKFEYECLRDLIKGKTFKSDSRILYSCPNNCDDCMEVIDTSKKFIRLKCNKCKDGFNNLNGICILNIDININENYEKYTKMNLGENKISVYDKMKINCENSNSKICLKKFYNNDNSFNYPAKYKNTNSEFEFNILNPEKNFNLIVFECINENDIFKNNKCQNCKENGGEVCKNLQILQCEYNKVKGNLNECINGNIENCFKFSDDNKCLECNDKYKINKEQKCEKCSLECEECNNEGCLKCKDGYFLELKKCFKCVDDNALSCKSANISYECNSDYILNKDFKCVKCLSHEEDIKMSNCEGECLNFNYCKKCIKNYFQNENNICTKCEINNCIDCLDFNNCKECDKGYFLFNGKCVECNYPCKTCSSEKNCFTCIENFLFNIKTYTCEKCNVTICKKCHDIYSYCISCYNGFYLDLKDNICKKCNDNCNNCKDLEDNCISCNEGFNLKKIKNKNICVKTCSEKNYFYNLKMKKCLNCEPNFEKEGNNYFLKENIILLIKPGLNFQLNKTLLNENIDIYYDNNIANKIDINFELKENAFLIKPVKEFLEDKKIFFEIKNKFINQFNDCNINSNFTKFFEIKKNNKKLIEKKINKINETIFYNNGTYNKRVNFYNNYSMNKSIVFIILSYFLMIFHNFYYIIGIFLFIKKPIIINSFIHYYIMLKLYLCFILYFISLNKNINLIDYFLYQIDLYKIYIIPINNNYDLKKMNFDIINFIFPKLSNVKNPNFLNININTCLIIILLLFKVVFNFIKKKLKIKNIKINKIMQDESKLNINNKEDNKIILILKIYDVIKLNFSFFLNNLILISLIIEIIDKLFDIIFYLKPINFDYLNFYFFINNIVILLFILLIFVFYYIIIIKNIPLKIKKLRKSKLDFNTKYWKVIYLNKLYNYYGEKDPKKYIENILHKFNFLILFIYFNVLFFENFIIKSLITFIVGFLYYYAFDYNKNLMVNFRISIIFLILIIRNFISSENQISNILYSFYILLVILKFTFIIELIYYIIRINK